MTDPRAISTPIEIGIESAPRPLGATSGHRRSRPWVAALFFALLVIAPSAVAAWYLWEHAADRYASRAAFSIRSNETTAPLEIFGAITQLGNSSAVMDGEVIYDFIRSQQMLDEVRAVLPLAQIYNRAGRDLLFTLGSDQPVEELMEHWSLMTDVSIDPATGILSVEARAFSASEAREIAEAILHASAELMNELSEAARADSVRFAAFELQEAETRLRTIRARLRAFRDLEQEVDPTQNASAALGLVATLEEDRARAKIRLDELSGRIGKDAPSLRNLRRRITTLDAQIAEERTRLGSGETPGDGAARPLAAVVGDYEELVVDREFAEQAYTLALGTYEQAQADARRRNRYLAVHVRPTLSEEAEYPDRPIWLVTIIALSAALWAIIMLLSANIRERR